MRHHGEALRAVSRDSELVTSLERDPANAPLDERSRALVDYALKLTRRPEKVTSEDLEPLRAAGLTDAGIHDAAAVTAYFNFVNRMASGLGVELESE